MLLIQIRVIQMQITRLQKYVMELAYRPYRWNIVIGAVGTGKSKTGLWGFCHWGTEFNTRREGTKYMAVAKTKMQLRSFIKSEIRQFAELRNIRFKHDRENSRLYVGLNQILLCDASDANAFERFQGETVAGIYFDEIPNLDEEVVSEAVNRVRYADGKFVATGNPHHPYSWVKIGYVDKIASGRINGELIELLPGVNPAISNQHYQDLWNEKSPGERRRIFRCEWAPLSGSIWPEFTVISGEFEFSRIIVGIDFGMSNATASIYLGETEYMGERVWIAFDEYYEDGSGVTVAEHASHIYGKFGSEYNNEEVEYVPDPSAATIIEDLIRLGAYVAYPQVTDVIDGLAMVRQAIREKRLLVHERCINLLRESAMYIWDTGPMNRGIDKPVKKDDHSCDGLRYGFVNTGQGGLIINSIGG